MPQQREERTNHPRGAVITDTEDSNFYNKDRVMPPLISPEKYDEKYDNPHEYRSDPPSTKPTPELGHPSKICTKEPTSEPDYNYLSEPSAPMREGSMGHIDPKDIVRY